MNSSKYAKFLELKNDATVLKLEKFNKYSSQMDAILIEFRGHLFDSQNCGKEKDAGVILMKEKL